VGIPGRSNALTIARRLGLKPEVVDAAKSHVGAATDDINQVIAGLEAQRRQETKATEAQVAAGSETVSKCQKKQQHCRNANRHCGSNKLGGAERSLKPKGKLRSFASCSKAHDSASCPASNECPDSNCCSSSATAPPKPKLVSTASGSRPYFQGNTAEVLRSR